MEAPVMTAETEHRERHLAGKYLTFELGGEFYGLQILMVKEIIKLMEITEVPRTPGFVEGVINLRGLIIPVVDLRRKFDLEPYQATRETCTIVVDLEHVQTGLIVDQVAEVMNIDESSIEDAPSFGATVETEFILGMGKVEEKVIILLDISKILDQGDVAVLQSIN